MYHSCLRGGKDRGAKREQENKGRGVQSVAAGPGAVMSFAGLSGGHRRFVF